MTPNPFRYFKTSPEIIQLAVKMYVRFPLSLRNVEDLLHERGIDVCHESVRLWVDRFGPVFAKQIRLKRSASLRQYTQWQWHLDEVFVKINGAQHYLWCTVDHEGEVLECFVSKKRNKLAALRFLEKAIALRIGSDLTALRCAISAIKSDRIPSNMPTTGRRILIDHSDEESTQ